MSGLDLEDLIYQRYFAGLHDLAEDAAEAVGLVFGTVDPLDRFFAVALVPLGAGGVEDVADFDDGGAELQALADG